MASCNQGSFHGPSFLSSSPSDCKNQTHTHTYMNDLYTTRISQSSFHDDAGPGPSFPLASPSLSSLAHDYPLPPLSLSLSLSICRFLNLNTQKRHVCLIPLLLRFLLAVAEKRQHPFLCEEAKALVGSRYPFLLKVLANDPR